MEKITITRKELNSKYHLSPHHWERRHDDVLKYLSQFMDITESKTESGRYKYKVQGELPQNLPDIREWLRHSKEEKREAYKKYILENELTEEFKPNSKSKVARDAIEDFSRTAYGHFSPRSVVSQYVGPLMDKYGEKSDDHVWVRYDTYEPLPKEALDDLKYMFKSHQLDMQHMACAWIKERQGQDTTKEKNDFKIVLNIFKDKYHYFPVLVPKWRLKK